MFGAREKSRFQSGHFRVGGSKETNYRDKNCHVGEGREALRRATRIFSRTRRRQEKEASEFPEVNSGTEKGMTDLLRRRVTDKRSAHLGPLSLQVRTRGIEIGCLCIRATTGKSCFPSCPGC